MLEMKLSTFSVCSLSLLACVGVLSCSSIQPTAPEFASTESSKSLSAIGIKNLREVAMHRHISGQPKREQFMAIGKAGVKNVINLRPSSELAWNEGATVKRLGMSYQQVPMTSVAGLAKANVNAFDRAL